MKNLFKKLFYLFLSIFLFFSCSSDDESKDVIKQAPVFTTNMLSSDSYDAKVSEALQIANANMNMRSTQKSVVNDTLNNLWIHTDKVHHIVSGEYESYTFAVEDPTDTLNLKNLMLHKQLDGSYLPILFTYDLNTSDLSNSVIQYQILDKTLVSSTQKSGLIDFFIKNLNPCGWDDSCACWRLDGDIIIIQMTSDTCNIFSAPVDDTISPGEGPSGGGSNSDPGSGGDPNNNPGGGPYTGSGSSSGSGSSNPDQPGNNDSADHDAPDDCLQLSNGDCFNGAATAPVKLERPSPVDPDTRYFFNSLEDELRNFINDPKQNELRREIDEYLQDENHSQEAKDLVEEVIDAILNDEYRVVFGPKKRISDINDYLRPFDITIGASVTIYVDQPVANTRQIFTTGSDKAGHAFVGISQNNVTRVMGFYPDGDATPLNPEDASIFGDNSGNSYDVSITVDVSPFQLAAILTETREYDQDYHLSTNNCTDYALVISQLAGLNLPATFGNWLGGSGLNPADFGQDMRNYSPTPGVTVNSSGGSAPSNSGN